MAIRLYSRDWEVAAKHLGEQSDNMAEQCMAVFIRPGDVAFSPPKYVYHDNKTNTQKLYNDKQSTGHLLLTMYEVPAVTCAIVLQRFRSGSSKQCKANVQIACRQTLTYVVAESNTWWSDEGIDHTDYLPHGVPQDEVRNAKNNLTHYVDEWQQYAKNVVDIVDDMSPIDFVTIQATGASATPDATTIAEIV